MTRARNLSLCFVVVALALGPAPGAAQCRDSTYREHYRDGIQNRDHARRAKRRGEEREAAQYWEAAVGDLGRALRACDREDGHRVEISGQREEDYFPRLFLGEALFELGRIAQAAEHLLEAERLGSLGRSSRSSQHARMLSISRSLGDVETAITAAEAARESLRDRALARGSGVAATEQAQADELLLTARRGLRQALETLSTTESQRALEAAQLARYRYQALEQSLVAEDRRAPIPGRIRTAMTELQQRLNASEDWRETSAYRGARSWFDESKTLRLETLPQARLDTISEEVERQISTLDAVRSRFPPELREAIEAYRELRYETVLRLLQNATFTSPRNKQWHQLLIGAAYFARYRQQGRQSASELRSATTAFRRAREIDAEFEPPAALFSPALRVAYRK